MISNKAEKNKRTLLRACRSRLPALVIVCLALNLTFFAHQTETVHAKDKDFKLTIMHVNDTHGHIAAVGMSIRYNGRKVYLDAGGFPRLAAKVSAVRESKGPSLVLHGGDVFQGTLYFTRYQGLADAELMNLVGFDAMVLGNHEFDKGSDVLARFLKRAAFPILAANIDFAMRPELQGIVVPQVVKQFDKAKVAIIGLAPQETPWISSPDPSLVFDDPIDTARVIVKKLETQGINKIIILSHIGYDLDVRLAKTVDGIDLVVGGHSHTLLGDFDDLGMSSKGPYPTKVRTPSGASAYVVQAWQWAKVLGVLNVVFDDHGEVKTCEGNPIIISGDTFWTKNSQGAKISVKESERIELLRFIESSPYIETVTEDPKVKSRLAFYDKGLKALKSEVIVSVEEDLIHVRTPKWISSEAGHKWKTSSVAPLVAESMLWKARSVGSPVQAVIQNAGGIRTDLSKGPLTAAQVYELLPFGNTLYLLKLTGQELRSALENGVYRGGGAFPYVAGLRYKAKLAGIKENRIRHVEIKNIDEQWEALDEKAIYLIGTNSYLASGGNGYETLKKASSYRYDTNFVDAEIFIEYAKRLSVLRRPVDTGITLVR